MEPQTSRSGSKVATITPNGHCFQLAYYSVINLVTFLNFASFMLTVFKVGILGSSQKQFATPVKKMPLPPPPPSSVSGYGPAQKISETSMVDLKANKVQRVKRNNASLVIIIFVIFILKRKIQKKTGFHQCTNSPMFSMRLCNFRQIILLLP